MWIRISLMRIRILDRPREKNGSGSKPKNAILYQILFHTNFNDKKKKKLYTLYEVIIYVVYQNCKYDFLSIFLSEFP